MMLLFGGHVTNATAEPTSQVPRTLSVGLDLCVRNGTSNEQYRARLQQLTATLVPKSKRILFQDTEDGEEWKVTVDGISYETAFGFPANICGLVGPGDPDDVKSALWARKPQFVYHHTNPDGQEVYKGQIDGEAITVFISSHITGEIFLGFDIDKMWDEFYNRLQKK
jgi:hypothetical protein